MRVSTQEQDVQLQVDALEKAGCLENDIFIDYIWSKDSTSWIGEMLRTVANWRCAAG